MILIVDDFADAAEALRRLLNMAGYPAIAAHSGLHALEAIRAHPAAVPLLVVLDDLMPGLGGIEVLRAIRADPGIARTPVMFHSANFDAERRKEALASGAAAWLPKDGFEAPSVEDVVHTIASLYEKIGGTASSAAQAPKPQAPTPSAKRQAPSAKRQAPELWRVGKPSAVLLLSGR